MIVCRIGTSIYVGVYTDGIVVLRMTNIWERYGGESMENSSLNHTENHKTEEKETKRTPIKQRKKENEVLRFIREHIRYFAAGALVVVLVIVLAMCAKPKGSDSDVVVNATESTQATEEAYQVDANENINAILRWRQMYRTYMRREMLRHFPRLQHRFLQMSRVTLDYFHSMWMNIRISSAIPRQGWMRTLIWFLCRWRSSLREWIPRRRDWISSMSARTMTVLFTSTTCTASIILPTRRTRSSIQNLIGQFESESDVMALQSEVQTRYDEALAADENLTNMIQTTIPAAIKDWVSQMAAQAATEQTEAAEATEQPETEQPQETEQQEEIIQQTDTLATKDRVNVRAAADVESEKLGTLDQGTVVTRTAIAGDWSVIDYNGTAGYVKNEFLTYDLPDTTADSNSDSSADDSDSTNVASIAEGTVIMLQNTTNIRSGMSEDSSKVGTAYAGEKVTVVMSYAEGWTKVKWNGETGYIKTSLLQ